MRNVFFEFNLEGSSSILFILLSIFLASSIHICPHALVSFSFYFDFFLSMPRDSCDHTFGYPNMCKITSTSEKLLVPTSLSTVQAHMPNRNYVVTATLMTVTFCFHNAALSCFILNEIFAMLQRQTQYLG